MSKYDRTIYVQHNGKMVKITDPTGPVDRYNFIIQWNGRDWSGFRTLAECEKQFTELEASNHRAGNPDSYTVIER